MANSTVSNKNTGDTLSADELNDIVTAVNSKADKGEIVLKGDKGDKGDIGETGTTGPGVPNGGITGQILAKFSDNDLETHWVTPPDGGSSLPVNVSDTNSIPFNSMLTVVKDHTMTGVLVITPNIVGAVTGCGATQRIVADGSNVPDLSAFKLFASSSSYNNAVGAVNILIFYFDGVSYNVGVTQNGEIILPNANTEVNAWVSRLAIAGYSISAQRKSAWLDFMNTLKAHGIYNLITEMWCFEGGTAATNILGFKGISNGVLHGTITHSATGSKGDGLTGHMGLGISPDAGGSSISNGSSRSIHISAYLRLNEVGGSGAGHDAVGVRGTSGTEQILSVNPLSSGYPSYFSLGGVTLNHNTSDTNGRFIASNNNPNTYVLINGANVASTNTNTSTSTNNVELSAFASIDGTGVSSYSPQEIGFLSIGKGLTEAQAGILDSALSTLLTAISR